MTPKKANKIISEYMGTFQVRTYVDESGMTTTKKVPFKYSESLDLQAEVWDYINRGNFIYEPEFRKIVDTENYDPPEVFWMCRDSIEKKWEGRNKNVDLAGAFSLAKAIQEING